MTQEIKPIIINCDDPPVINPPDSMSVVSSGKPILYTHDEKPVYRKIGFRVRN